MENNIENYYKEYQVILEIIKNKTEEIEKLVRNLEKSKAGKLYFSLNDEQKELFVEIYSDPDFTKYINLKADIKEYKAITYYLENKITEHKNYPFKEEGPAIYINDGVDTYNAITDENTKDIDLSIKEIIKELISEIYGFEDNITLDDIPLIKVIYHKLIKQIEKIPLQYYRSMKSILIEDDIYEEVERIHELDKKHITYKENRRNVIADLKEKIKENEIEIRNSDSPFKYLLLFSITAAKYEVSLLEGKRVTTILKEIEESNMDEPTKAYYKDALVKAYSNLTDIDFRRESEYFDNDTDIRYASFETANPEINKRLIKMREGE